MPVVKALNRMDNALPAQGWKSAIVGLIGTLFPLVNEVLLYIGKEPLPHSLTDKIQMFLGAVIVLFMAMKAARPRQYDGRS